MHKNGSINVLLNTPMENMAVVSDCLKAVSHFMPQDFLRFDMDGRSAELRPRAKASWLRRRALQDIRTHVSYLDGQR